MESQINKVWDAYRHHYYGKNAVGSVYLKEIEGLAFLACFLIQQDIVNKAAIKEVKTSTEAYGITSSEAVLAWETVEEISSSSTWRKARG